MLERLAPPRETRPRILLSGMYGEINAGDEAICLALVRGLRETLDRPIVRVMTRSGDRTESYTTLNGVDWLEGRAFTHRFWVRFFRFLRSIREADLVVVGGGGLFQDSFDWQLPAGSAFVAGVAVVSGVPTVVLGVGVGPLRRLWLRRVLQWILPAVDHVCVRDGDSHVTVRKLGVDAARLTLTADLAATLNIRELCPALPLEERSNTVGIALRRWEALNPDGAAELLDRIAAADHDLRLLCFEWPQDHQLYDSILARCKPATRTRAEVFAPRDLTDLWRAIAQARCILSMRLHGCIFALSLNTPFVPVEAERKVGGLAREVGLEDWLVDAEALSGDLLERIYAVEDFWRLNQSQLASEVDRLAARAELAFSVARASLENGEPVGRSRIGPFLGTLVLLVAGLLNEVARVVSWPVRVARRVVQGRGRDASVGSKI